MDIQPQQSQTLLSSTDFHRIQGLIYKHTAIVVPESKQDFIRARIMRRMRQIGLEQISDYCDLVESGKEPISTFTSQVTTNHTAFFRENHHFEYLVDHLDKTGIENRVIWSAGCSSGEEPYSIAIKLLSHYGDVLKSGLRLIATDLDETVLNQAINGIYPASRVSTLTQHQKYQCLIKGVGDQTGHVRIKKPIREFIEFGVLNLTDEFNFVSRVDVIFCRNVVIYFNLETKRELFRKMASLQESGDLLIIGHSESLNDISDDYECIGKTIYKRK